jgi:hypothetical protein
MVPSTYGVTVFHILMIVHIPKEYIPLVCSYRYVLNGFHYGNARSKQLKINFGRDVNNYIVVSLCRVVVGEETSWMEERRVTSIKTKRSEVPITVLQPNGNISLWKVCRV